MNVESDNEGPGVRSHDQAQTQNPLGYGRSHDTTGARKEAWMQLLSERPALLSASNEHAAQLAKALMSCDVPTRRLVLALPASTPTHHAWGTLAHIDPVHTAPVLVDLVGLMPGMVVALLSDLHLAQRRKQVSQLVLLVAPGDVFTQRMIVLADLLGVVVSVDQPALMATAVRHLWTDGQTWLTERPVLPVKPAGKRHAPKGPDMRLLQLLAALNAEIGLEQAADWCALSPQTVRRILAQTCMLFGVAYERRWCMAHWQRFLFSVFGYEEPVGAPIVPVVGAKAESRQLGRATQ